MAVYRPSLLLTFFPLPPYAPLMLIGYTFVGVSGSVGPTNFQTAFFQISQLGLIHTKDDDYKDNNKEIVLKIILNIK